MNGWPERERQRERESRREREREDAQDMDEKWKRPERRAQSKVSPPKRWARAHLSVKQNLLGRLGWLWESRYISGPFPDRSIHFSSLSPPLLLPLPLWPSLPLLVLYTDTRVSEWVSEWVSECLYSDQWSVFLVSFSRYTLYICPFRILKLPKNSPLFLSSNFSPFSPEFHDDWMTGLWSAVYAAL